MEQTHSTDSGKLIKIKTYFGYTSLTEFRKDWNALSDEDKEWFRVEIDKV